MNGQGEIRTRGAVLPTQPLSRRLLSASQAPVQNEQRARFSMESFPVFMPEGLEPSFDAKPESKRVGTQNAADVPGLTPDSALLANVRAITARATTERRSGV